MRRAFTMAEVLITLGIIGIVAAMTLPGLIARHRSKVLEAQFKKRYSELSQAISMLKSKEEYVYGVYDGPNFQEVLVKQYSGAKTAERSIYLGNSTYQKRRLGFELPVYKTFNKLADFSRSQLDDGFIYHNQDFFIYINADNNNLTNKKIAIDINGSKGPNIAGFDLFIFDLDKTDSLRAYTENKGLCSANDTSALNGISCSYYAMTDGDYFYKLGW